MTKRFAIDPANISHERLQDEVIIINLSSGAYFSGTGSAADLWTLLSQGAAADEASKLLASVYSIDEALALQGIETCIDHLVAEHVLSVAPEAAPPGSMILPELQRSGWSAPMFDEYTDMWDLLKYDPIHDVNDAGWPYAVPVAKE